MSVQQDSLPSFLSTAELLSVQGLTGGSSSSSVLPGNDTPAASSVPSTGAYVQTHQNTPPKLVHMPTVKREPATSATANVKTFSVQAVKTQVPAPISIPATVKLRAIPAASTVPKSSIVDHPIVIHQQQQQQSIDNAPSKKRRISIDTTASIQQHSVQQQQQQQQQLVEDTEFVLSQQPDDEGDTHDEEEDEDQEPEEEEESE